MGRKSSGSSLLSQTTAGRSGPAGEFCAEITGTLDDMAPEQASLRRVRCDARSDVSSLGATLFRLVCGELPHSGGNYRTLAERLDASTLSSPPLQSRRPVCPAELADLIDQSLAIDASLRPASMQEVADRLEPFCDPAPLRAAAGDSYIGLSGSDEPTRLGSLERNERRAMVVIEPQA